MVTEDFQPDRMFLFFQRGVGPVSVGIAWVTATWGEVFSGRWKDLPSHCGIGFSDGESMACFEAHAHTDGWHGPFCEAELMGWLNAKEGRRMWIADIEGPHVTPGMVQAKYVKACTTVGLWPYDKPGILRSWLYLRFRLPIPSTGHKVWCSEAVSRILAEDIQLRAAAGVKRHEYLTPANEFRTYKKWTTASLTELCPSERL